MSQVLSFLIFLLICLGVPSAARAQLADGAVPAPRLLPVPLALGGTPGFFGPSPGTADLAAHLRGTVLFGTELPGAPALAMRWNLGASVSLWRWAEAGARFSGRWDLEARQHAPGPVELWVRAGPPDLRGAALQAVLEHAAGRGGFDEGGRLWTSTTNIGAAVAARPWRFAFSGSLTYERAEDDGAPAAYQGLRAGAGIWFAAARAGEHLGLDVGGDALVRLGGTQGPRGPLELAAVFAVGVRLVDEVGAAFRAGYGQGHGPGMPARFGLIGIGWSYGRPYRYERTSPVLLDELSDWLRQEWARRTAPGFGPRWRWLPPPALRAAPPPPPLFALPSCRFLPELPARGLSALALQACRGAWDAASGPPAPTAGPPPPKVPAWPLGPPAGLAQALPPRGGPRAVPRGAGPRAAGRGGAGWTEVAEPSPEELPPTVWTGGRPGGPTMGEANAPPPAPSIPTRPQPPGPLPVGVRPESVPPFLRPHQAPPARAGDAEHMQPMALRPSAPPAQPPSPADTPAPATARGGAGPVRQGQRGVAGYVNTRAAAGAKVDAQEVSIRTSQGIRRVDVVEREPGGGRIAIEVKSGGSRYTRRQRAKDEEIATQGGVGVGPRAEQAGLAGPIKIKTKVVRVP